VLAKGVLPDPAGSPLFYRLQRVELEPGRAFPTTEGAGIVFVLPGSPLAVAAAGTRTLVAPGTALLLPAHSGATLASAEGSLATFFLIGLGPAGVQDPVGNRATEWFRSPEPLPGLGTGSLSFDVTQVTFPPHMPANPPHHRTGDALYVVLAGTGEFTTQGKVLPRPPGTCHFEPSGMVHQWANPGATPLVLLVANVTREGTPALAYDSP
jgi:mannose-6-phosphate isomerase-like protein (cupin superfamily)